jgi:hypothetical protein
MAIIRNNHSARTQTIRPLHHERRKTAVSVHSGVAAHDRLARTCSGFLLPGGLRRQEGLSRRPGLPGGTREVGGNDVGGVAVQAAAGALWRIVVRWSACEAASCTSRSGTPASRAAVMNACRSVGGVTSLAIPARRAVLRTIRPAACRSSRFPSAARNTDPSVRSPMARSIVRAVRGASGRVTTLPPLRVMVRVRCHVRGRGARYRRRSPRRPQPVQGEQRDQRVPGRRAEASRCQQRAEFVAVQGNRMGLVVHPRPPDVRRRGAVQEFLLDGVLAEPRRYSIAAG